MTPSLPAPLRRTLSVLFLAFFSAASIFAADGKKNFDLPRGDAAKTLKQFAAQAQCEIVFSPEKVKGAQTQEVIGDYTVTDALEHMLKGTGLSMTEDRETGALAVRPESSDEKNGASPRITDAGANTQGNTISGRVSAGNSGLYIVGARVTDTETGQSTTTDREGRFTLPNLNPGPSQITIDSIGYDTKTQNVTVPRSGTAYVTVRLDGGVLQMSEFVIESSREGRSRALQQKSTAINNLDIISADAVGALPDRNVAEALSRVAGLSITQSSGEGQFVSIRGVEPNLNNVTFNGTTVAPPGVGGRSGRATQLDIIAASQIAQVEVIKSVTPDMDANSLGGTINVKTVSGFDRSERFTYGALEMGSNLMSDKSLAGADFTYGNVFGKDRTFGVAFAASYSNRHYTNDEISTSWSDFNNQPYIEDFDLEPRHGTRERLGLNLNLELRPDNDTQFFIRSIYNIFNQEDTHDDINLSVRRDPNFTTPTSFTFDRIRSEDKIFHEKSKQTLTNITAGGSKKINNLTIDAEVTYSRGKESSPAFRGAQYRTGNVNAKPGKLFSVDFSQYYPVFDHQDILADPTTAIPFRRFRIDDSLTIENTYTPKADIRWDFDNLFGGKKGFFKVGVKYTDRHRTVDNNSHRPSTENFTIDQMGARLPGVSFFDGQYRTPLNVDLNASLSYLAAHPTDFPDNELNSVQNSVEDDFDIKEKITAGYTMVSVDMTPQLTIMGGLRYEHTDASLTGFEVQQNSTDTDTGALLGGIVTNTGSYAYNDYLPNAQFRYQWSKQLVLRGAYTQTIGRPAYEDAAPIASFVAEPDPGALDPAFPNTGSLEIGNPQLKPYRAQNYDISLEYYLKSVGVFSVGLFRKDISNPIYHFSEVRRNTVHNKIALASLSVDTTKNADAGKIQGAELSAQFPFSSFTSGFLDGFGVNLNGTFITSEVHVFDRPNDDLTFFKQPDRIYNASLYYDKNGFNARIAYNYQSESLDEVGNNAANDIYNGDRYFVDIQAGYRFTKNLSVYGLWRNITNQADESYIGNKNRLDSAHIYGSEVRVGVRFNF